LSNLPPIFFEIVAEAPLAYTSKDRKDILFLSPSREERGVFSGTPGWLILIDLGALGGLA